MIPRSVLIVICAIGGGALLATSQTASAQTCPENLCACLGNAAAFDVLATSLKAKTGSLKYSGYSYPVAVVITGNVCADSASVSGSGEAVVGIGSLASLAPQGEVAATFKAKKIYGELDPGTSITGDLTTGGGSISGLSLVTVGGVTDTTGGHASIASCAQAKDMAANASATLAALTATQNLGQLKVQGGPGAPTIIATSPGVNVINTTSISLKKESELQIDVHENADTVILNTGGLRVGAAAAVVLTGLGADPQRVVINVLGGKVKVSQGGRVEAVILAPTGSVSAGTEAQVSSLLGGKISLQGALAGGMLSCP